MDKNELLPLLARIYSIGRNAVESTFFNQPSKLVLLDFIGASKYFITESGLIWNREKTFLNHRGKLAKYYQPQVFLDPYFPYPWVLLQTTTGEQWYPVNQLLGWAYRPNEPEKHYFLLKQPKLMPYKIDDFEWSNRPAENVYSFYLRWMKDIGL